MPHADGRILLAALKSCGVIMNIIPTTLKIRKGRAKIPAKASGALHPAEEPARERARAMDKSSDLLL